MRKVQVWAHRGASGYAPENTLESFQMAVDMGADAIELDVQLTADGEVVVIHDESIDRVSAGTGYVKDYTLSELKQMHFNRGFPSYEDARIPTLSEVYELIAPTGLLVNVELKTSMFRYPGMEEKCLMTAKEFNMDDRIIYSSFYHPSLMKLLAVDPSAKIGFLVADGWLDDLGGYCRRWGASALHPYCTDVTDKMAKQCHDEGIDMNVWSMDETPRMTASEMSRMIHFGAHALITNYPDVAIEAAEV